MKTNMADNSGPSQAISPNSDGGNDDKDKEKEKKLADLMQILRTRHSHRRTWDDTIKSLRNSDKRHQSEAFEKAMLQKHMDTLAKACRVDSLTLMVDRLEMMARHVGMQFTSEKVNTVVHLAYDLVQVEVQLESTGVAKEVKVRHIHDPVSCPDMVTALNEGDFEEFQKHLEGLIAAVHVGHDKKTKSKCLIALHALETDLTSLVQYQSSITGTSNYIHKSPLGIVLPRSGGHPLKMTYFVHPYDLLDKSQGKCMQLSLQTIKQHKLGCSISVGLESSTPHRLQNMPLLSVGKNLPSFVQASNHTSNQVPAVFVLQLNRPTPLSLSTIRKIKNTTGVEVPMTSKIQPILQHLIKMNCKNSKKMNPSKGLYVTVPDQNHCYFMHCSSDSDDLQGAVVSKIPFEHPANVAKVLMFLRQQMMFNTIMSSCIRSNPKQDVESSMTFEVTPLSLQHIVVTFEHPATDSIATAELNLSEITNVLCQIRSTDENSVMCPNEYVCKVMQRCLSIPVTMRAILKKATAVLGLVKIQSPLPAVPFTPRILSKLGQDHRLAFMEAHKQGTVNSLHSDTVRAMPTGYIDPTKAPSEVLEAIKIEKIHRNPMLASLLDVGDGGSGKNVEQQPTSMLSALLGDQPPPTTKQKRPRKRRSERSPGSLAKSPKKRPLEDDMGSSSNLSSVEVSPSQSTQGFEPSPSHSSGKTTPVSTAHGAHTSLSGLLADDSYMMESPVTKLATTVDSIIKQESKNVPATHPNDGFGVNDKTEDGHRRKSTGSSLAELLESSPKCDQNNMYFSSSKDRSNSTSDLTPSSLHPNKPANDVKPELGSPYDFKLDPVLNDSGYKSKEKSDSMNATLFNHERHSGGKSLEKSNSSLWEHKLDSLKSEEKKSRKEKRESVDEKPQEREKIEKITVKLSTAKSSVKEPRSSPSQDTDLNKSHSRESKSSKDKANREKVYDISSSDETLPSSLMVTRPLQDGTRSVPSSTLKIRKISREDGKGEKKRKKHEGESFKRKRDESSKKDKNKKRKIYSCESSVGDSRSTDRYAAVEKGPTTIKITTKIGSNKMSLPVKSSKSLSSSTSSIKSPKADRLSVSPQSSKPKSSLKSMNRSKSEPQAINLNRSSLNPTIKLKPVVIPHSATSINVSSNKGSGSPGSAPTKSSLESSKSKLTGPKNRKPPLDAIVDKLKTKQGTTPLLAFRSKADGGQKKDANAQRNELDEVRKAIIQQGIGPKHSTKELTSYKSGPSMRPSKLSLDSNKRSESKGSGTPTNPIPKLSQSAGKSSPASSASKLGTIPKTSNSSSNSNNSDYSMSKGNSSSGNNYSSSNNSSGDYSSRDSTNRLSGPKSEGSRLKLSSSSSGHGPPDSACRNDNSDKREVKESVSASSTPSALTSTTVPLSLHGNSVSTSSNSSGNSYSSPSHSTALSSTPASAASSAPSLSLTNNTSKDPPKDDKKSKRSVDDISERLSMRHFLDAVTKLEDGGEEEKKSNKASAEGRTDFTELPDRVRPNGYNKNDRLSDSWASKEDGSGSSDSYSSANRTNCVESPGALRADRRTHTGSEDKENSMGRDDDTVFRAPTPKGSKSGMDVTEDRLEPRARSDSRTKPVLSPRSDISSPEDGLVIDCPGTPKTSRSPAVTKPTTPNCNDKSRMPQSPSHQKTKASPCLSPAKSPGMLHSSPIQSPDANSQVDDDELMDVALIM